MTEQIRTSSKIIINSDCCNISIHNSQIVFNKSNKKLHFISFYSALTTNGDRSQYKTNVLFITILFILIQASATSLFLYNFDFIWNSLYSRLLYNLIMGFYVLIFTLQSWVIPSSAGRRLAGLVPVLHIAWPDVTSGSALTSIWVTSFSEVNSFPNPWNDLRDCR